MTERDASQTAQGVALLRAAHNLIDDPPPILDDPVIVRMVGPEGEKGVREAIDRLQSAPARGMRSHIVLRSRFAEDSLREAVARGAEQYVLLGAGLDTFAYRQPAWARALDIIEVDHPASQAVKRRMLVAAGIELPPNVRYAGIDFEHETIAEGLRRHGVAFDKETFFSWLGVTMYLTRDAIDAVLATVASFPKGSEIVLTFTQPPDPDRGPSVFAERAAALGEPWISFFTLPEMEALLRGHGFSDVRFLMREDAQARYYLGRSDGLQPPRRASIATAVV